MTPLTVLFFLTVSFKSWSSAQTCVAPTSCVAPDCITLKGVTYTRFYHCDASTHTLSFSLSDIETKAKGATQVLITRPDGTYALSVPNSFPIRRLRNGQTISFDQSPPSRDIYPSLSETLYNWRGNASLQLLAFGSHCTGQPKTIDQELFLGCNSSGLQILADQTLCSWNATHYEGEINVYADFDVNSCLSHPCYSCNATCRDLSGPGIDSIRNRVCTCNQGYGGNGDNCTACSVNATWVNGSKVNNNGRGGGRHLLNFDNDRDQGNCASGPSQCRCNTGFIGNGTVCTVATACDLHPCRYGANCTLAPNTAPYNRTCNCSCGTYDERYGCQKVSPSVNVTSSTQGSNVLLSVSINGTCTAHPSGYCNFNFRSSTRRVSLINGTCNATISSRDWSNSNQCAEIVYSGDSNYRTTTYQVNNRQTNGHRGW